MSSEVIALNGQAVELMRSAWGVSEDWKQSQHKAMLLLRKALEYDEVNVFTLTNLGCALSNSGRHNQAIEVLMRAVELKSTDRNTYFNLAVSMMNVAAQRPNARTYFERATNFDAEETTESAYFDPHAY